jgi:hypothetical protein
MAEAESIILDVREENIPHPDLISEKFIFLTYHTDKETKIFVRSPIARS